MFDRKPHDNQNPESKGDHLGANFHPALGRFITSVHSDEKEPYTPLWKAVGLVLLWWSNGNAGSKINGVRVKYQS